MIITIASISILAISAVVWLANRVLPITICPICAGVFLTWVGLVGANLTGYPVDLAVPALLMGGTVVGTAYQFEKKFGGEPSGVRKLWKVLFIPTGFIAAYAVLEQSWVVFLGVAIFLCLISLALASTVRAKPANPVVLTDIERRMKDCC
ncbi:hypothetical protein A3G63_03270 [Candidatus Kaiserbacteria bacterium RIFCSPLOWO2_12_FULL_52_8]|uniref:Uncharacterized protein n=1 Tax=Candidatus Kaiserbacteria bacterium RIFCSPHIGHO2_01_FULL_53_31 TaxID=1798481 RepID=A0A1F6CI25_9BACT|nr:MAG: hypothetical protein A2678_02500 [Candidatus Kaiserbacteria bacterium RIFCSPHIGHO2_01_FULL_53_31]OGG93514.1 MAG: hypothetical protein A3G63_03270 [Candidatus Kaiserbacteria bacterium RIFCSPLOWO2_12_FULL_52_8]